MNDTNELINLYGEHGKVTVPKTGCYQLTTVGDGSSQRLMVDDEVLEDPSDSTPPRVRSLKVLRNLRAGQVVRSRPAGQEIWVTWISPWRAGELEAGTRAASSAHPDSGRDSEDSVPTG
jgi:hypothetical protein